MKDFDQKDQIIILIASAILLLLFSTLSYLISNNPEFRQKFQLDRPNTSLKALS